MVKLNRNGKFQISSPYNLATDQINAVDCLAGGINEGLPRQTLLGVTGSGKTFTIANVIERLNIPTLVIAHNKTLAAQLYSEFSELFPTNSVKYFVSFYDYYQPEAYIPTSDTYIEKDSSVNKEIDRLRHGATRSILERSDTIIIASVSCIYGLGDPSEYFDMMLYLESGEEVEKSTVLKRLVSLQFKRNDYEFGPGTFRVRGDVVDICSASEKDKSIRLEFFGDEIEKIVEIERISAKEIRELTNCCIYPASHYVTSSQKTQKALETIRVELKERLEALNKEGKTLEAARLEQRVLYDLELISEMGFCPGIENYSRHLTGLSAGSPPPTLIDYFRDNFLIVIDESHVTIPQVRAMYKGDRSRKRNLVEHGFRLPSALDNRPLQFDEFYSKAKQLIYVSATPAEFEIDDSNENVVQQIIRPTGLLDPVIEVKPASSQVEDFLDESKKVIAIGDKVLATTLTKKMAEHLSEYYTELGIRIKYLHSDIHTLDRIEIIRALQEDKFDILVGVNLLREGLDIPQVSLIGILDADKEGFLRSTTSLVQTIGRAARNERGRVILYGDKVTDSMKRAIDETSRRRKIQHEYNIKHGITPKSVIRTSQSLIVENSQEELMDIEIPKSRKELEKKIKALTQDMYSSASNMQFEEAAKYRDEINILERVLLTI